MNAISSATSGMLAAVARLDVSAENTANSQAQGGVSVLVQARSPGAEPTFLPYSPFADGAGMVATPDVNPAQESVDQMDALNQFKANLATVQTADDLLKAILDLKT